MSNSNSAEDQEDQDAPTHLTVANEAAKFTQREDTARALLDLE